MGPLRIIGAGGHGRVVADVAHAIGYSDIAFLDDRFAHIKASGQWPIIGCPHKGYREKLFCAIGDNFVRANMFAQYELNSSPTLVHPFSFLSPLAVIGSGTVIAAGVVVNAGANVGRGVILNTSCSVDHDCFIDDYVHISPGARVAGNVAVGTRSWIGIGAVIREGVSIGSNVVVAAGAAVVNDIFDDMVVGGVPAKPLSLRR